MSGEGSHFLVLLRTDADEILPIVVDSLQAMSIIAARVDEPPDRPHTHDLMLSLIDMLGARLLRVEITDLKEGTFYGQVVLDRGGVEVELDARPSDALALAARVENCPIMVAKSVMQLHAYTDDIDGQGFEA